MSQPGTAFRLQVEPDGLAVLTFDLPGEKVNKYSASVVKELDGLLDRLAASKEVKALVLFSGKPDIFIAGADVKEFSAASEAAVRETIERGHRVFGKLANLPFPTVAAIHGPCLGGGCETVLAMDWRLASDSKKTQVGLPEVKLGIIPAWGGTTRLPRIIGLAGALDIILNGKALDGKRAKKAGLVDEVAPEPSLRDFALAFARQKFGTKKRSNAGPGGGPRRARPATTQEKFLDGVGKRVVFSKARQAVMKQTRGHYPAPLEAIAAIEKGIGAPLDRALALEVEAVLRLVKTPVVRHLVGLFFQMEEVKKETGAPGVKPRKVSRIGVLGAGVMGGGIAQLAADKGYPVRMKDIKAEMLAGGYAAAAKIWREKVKKRRMTRSEFAGKMSLLSGSLDWAGFGTTDVTIEAVLEKLAVKQAVLKEWEAISADSAIFASNTSTLPITDIASAARVPERVVGMHFFNPVHKMPLVEVIWGAKTAPEVTATIFDLARRMGKTPVVVKDAPGFLVNRILAPYLGEAVRLLLEGSSMESIDRAMRAFGMPVGPIELLDDVGLLNERLTAAHCLFMTDADIARAGKAGITVAHIPKGNATGGTMAPTPRLRQAGARIALGTDNMHADMIEVMRWALAIARIQVGGVTDDWQPRDALGMATLNGARAMGLEHALGSLTEGKLADFVAIDMRRVHLTPCVNPLGNIVHVGQGRDVELVAVAGRIVVEDGQSTLVDSETIRREGQQAAQALWARC